MRNRLSAAHSGTDYRFIDIFKLFCSFLIVGIHSEPFAEFGILDSAFGMLTRIAVPFFFVSSSFFLFKKEFSWKRIGNYCKRMLMLYIVYSIIYVIYELASGQFIIYSFLIKFFISGYQHLWFLHQSVVAVLVISVIIQSTKKPWLLYTIAIVCFCIGVLILTYYPLTKGIPIVEQYRHSFVYEIIFERSWIFYAMPYMALGYYFAKNGFLKKSFSIFGIVISYLLLAAESVVGVYLINVPSTVLWFSVMPLSFFIFSLVSQIQLKSDMKTLTLRKLSTLIYCIHLLVIYLLGYLHLPLHLILFIAVSVISLLYGIIVIKLSSVKNLKFLNILY